MASHDINELYPAPTFLSSYKYWPDYGIVTLKIVANIETIK
jgi:hypothetical protein